MLEVYNTLGRERQEFKPLREGFVGIYVCGPTVYGHSHIGHAKSYVSFDVVVRYLRYLGYRVRYVQNITDVGHLTDDVDAMNVERPDISPRASGHIPEMVEIVETLLDKGHAYEVEGNVYYDVTSFEDYGKLSGRKLEDMMEGARVETRSEKKHPADFALWKRAEGGHIMRWNSPWGEGFPGWHLECSVMGTKYLGPTLDIHGGGLENAFPHHEDEIAQSEGATGKQFVRYWMHNNMVTVEGQKMGKSLGNFVTLKDAFAGEPPLDEPVRPLVMRYFVLTSHYRSPLDFSHEALEAARKGLERIEETVSRVRTAMDAAPEGEAPEHVIDTLAEHKKNFLAEMDQDFNTAGALGHFNSLTRDVNKILDSGEKVTSGTLKAIDDLYRELGGDILGIVTEDTGQRESAGLESELIQAMIDTRQKLREEGHYEMADHIRDRLAEAGVNLKDTPEGTTWEYA